MATIVGTATTKALDAGHATSKNSPYDDEAVFLTLDVDRSVEGIFDFFIFIKFVGRFRAVFIELGF